MANKRFNSRQASPKMKPLAACTLAALAVLPLYAVAEDSPFSIAPQHLSGTGSIKRAVETVPYSGSQVQTYEETKQKVTGSNGVQPNIVLLVDDSGSMADGVKSGTPTIGPGDKSRQKVLQESLPPIIRSYQDRIRWGVVPFNNAFNSLALGGTEGGQSNWESAARKIANIHVSGGTPTISRYIDAAEVLNKGLQYRCQQSYIVLLTDGDSNIETVTPKDIHPWGFRYGSNTNSVGNNLAAYAQNRLYDRVYNPTTRRYYEDYFARSPSDNRFFFIPYLNMLALNTKLNQSTTWRQILKRTDLEKDTQDSPSINKYNLLCSNDYRSRGQYSNGGTYLKNPDLAASAYMDKVCKDIMDTANANNHRFIYYPYSGVVDPAYWATNPKLVSVLQPFENGKAGFVGGTARYLSRRDVNGNQEISRIPILDTKHLTEHSGKVLSVLSEPLFTKDLRPDIRGQNRPYVEGDSVNSDFDKAGKRWDEDIPNQNITTFTISFGGASSQYGKKMLEEGASKITFTRKNNGRDETVTDHAFFDATDEQGLKDAFDSIFKQIDANTQPGEPGTPTVLPATANPTGNSTNAPQPDAGKVQTVQQEVSFSAVAPGTAGASNSLPDMAASVYVSPGLDSSEIRFTNLDSRGRVIRDPATQQPTYKLADFSERRAIINTGNSVTWADNNQSGLANSFFALQIDSQNRTDEWSAALLPWLTRKVADNNDQTIRNMNYPTPYRVRQAPTANDVTYHMGDVLDAPVVATGKNGAEQGNRQEFLITAANDGMVYLFQSNPNQQATHPYSLKLNYLPAAMPRQSLVDTHAANYQKLADEAYGKATDKPHLFMINGGIAVRTTEERAGNQQIFAVGALGQGGRGMYALNIGGDSIVDGSKVGLHADSSSWVSSVPLFEARAGDGKVSENSGYTVSTPQISRVSINYDSDGKMIDGVQSNIRQATFMASGFSAPNSQETALYIHDALGVEMGGTREASKLSIGKAGDLLAKITVPGGVGGLASPTILDANFDGVADYVFAGDYGGNMYRFDLRKVNYKGESQPADVVTRIYQGNGSQPITSAPAISYQDKGKFVVVFGTGSDIYANDFEDLNQQAVYGIYQSFDVANHLNPVNSMNPQQEEAGNVTYPLTAADLLRQGFTSQEVERTVNGETITSTVRNLSDNSIVDDTDKALTHFGWYIPLENNDGERVVVKPTMILNTVVLTTRIYKENKNATSEADSTWDKDTWSSTGWKILSELDRENYQEGEWSEPVKVGDAKTEITNSNSDDICIAKSSETTVQKYQQERTITYDKITTYEKVISSSNESSGWTLAFSASNGGAVSLKDGTGVDFLGEYTRDTIKEKVADSDNSEVAYYRAGLLTVGSLPNFTFLTAAASSKYSLTRHGESGGSGEDLPLNENPSGESTQLGCFANDNNFGLGGNTEEGSSETYNIYGQLCENSLRRIS